MGRVSRWLCGGLALAMATIGWSPQAGAASTGCRSGNPMANVHEPGRLRVVSRCMTASGVVTIGTRQKDGDLDLFLKPDRGSARLLNDRNRRYTRGSLLLEVVPADQPGCRKGQPVTGGTCTGANVRSPRSGTHVTVTGPYVLDRDHGWMEIHPVWRISPS